MVNRICIIQAGLLILGAGVHSTQILGLLAHGKTSRGRNKKKILDKFMPWLEQWSHQVVCKVSLSTTHQTTQSHTPADHKYNQ
jgi:hypothetical protein